MIEVKVDDSFKLCYDDEYWGMAMTVYGCTLWKLLVDVSGLLLRAALLFKKLKAW